MRTSSVTSRLLNSVGIGALIAGGFSAAALAQGASDVEQVVVTGSRIGTPGFTTPTPVTEISPLQYEVKNVQTIVDLMADIPSLTPNQGQTAVADVGVSNLNLRDLGQTRTLVMVNGLRTEATSVNGGYDVNVIPASLIQRVDVITGGASAAYGSDAVAGVVSFTLNTTLQGLKAKASWGMTDYGDDEKYNASVAWGTDFAGGRGHIVLGGEYYNQLGVINQWSRPWGRSQAALITNPACTTITTTCVQQIRALGTTSSNMTDGGVILGAKTSTGAASSAITNIQFGVGGTPMPFTLGQYAGSQFMVGGSGSLASQTMSLDAKIKRDNFLAHTSYDLTDDISVWTELLYSRSSQFTAAAPNYNNGNLTLTAQNAFIPASVQSLIVANKITTFTFSRSNIDLGPIDFGRYISFGRNEDYDASGGIKGKTNVFGTEWSWNIGLQYDSHFFRSALQQNQIAQPFLNAVDSVVNPAVGGVAGVPVGLPVCRSTLTNPTNGCVPINLFGLGSPSSAAIAYVMGTQDVDATLNMADISANLSGSPFSSWAGPVSIAVGAEARTQSTRSIADPISAASGFRNNNQIPYAGHNSVEEGYLEVDVPLLKNSPIGTSADIDGAVRATSYSTSGGVTTWKVSANYSPVDDVRLRATRSHDIRAPGLSELFQTGTLRTGNQITNPLNGNTNVTQTLTRGNPNLNPEIGDTITAGVVYTPSWLDGFHGEVDYWNIKMTQVLTQFSAQTVVNNCLLLKQQAFCDAVQFDANTGQIAVIATTAFNESEQKTDGWDLELGYNFDADSLVKGWGGTVQTHLLATYVNELINTGSSGIPVDTAGSIANNAPRLKYNLNMIYLNDPWTVSVSGNWLGGGMYNALFSPRYTSSPNAALLNAKTINDNRVNGRFYVNLSVSYQLSNVWGVFLRANNLLNSSPPIIPDGLAFPHVSNQTIYDHVGGQWQIGVKLNLD